MKQLFLFFSIVFITSCAPTLSELWVNDDDSGRMEMTYELGEMAGMLDAMMNEAKEENGTEGEEMADEGSMDSKEVKDSTMNFFDIMPDSIKQKLDRPELLKNMEMKMLMDEINEEYNFTMSIQYKNDQELNDVMMELGKLQENGSDVNPMLGMMSGNEVNGLMIRYKADKKNNVVRMPRVNMLEEMANDPDIPGDFMSDIDSLMNIIRVQGMTEENQDQIDMLKMFMGGETKTVVHAPGKILFTNDANAVIEGSKVTFTTDLLKALMDGEEPQFYDWVIKYK